jgi:hypothetical protein
LAINQRVGAQSSLQQQTGMYSEGSVDGSVVIVAGADGASVGLLVIVSAVATAQ